jgi:hypothetical protein
MRAPFDTAFLIRRIGQLWAEAANLPEGSAEQERIETLACDLSDYVSALHEASTASQARERIPILNPWCYAEQ